MKYLSLNFMAATSVTLTILVLCACMPGVLGIITYPLETSVWRAQCALQDQINIAFILPCLISSNLVARKRKLLGSSLWAACMGYLAYTFAIYCFCIHFNEMFIVYCGCLGVSFFSVLFFILMSRNERAIKLPASLLKKLAVYFMFLASGVALLWFSEIFPAMATHSAPVSTRSAGLFTNGVYVLDLSIVLPAVFITGRLLFKRSRLAILATPVILVFFALMTVSVAYMALQNGHGLRDWISIACIALTFVFVNMILLKKWLHAATKNGELK